MSQAVNNSHAAFLVIVSVFSSACSDRIADSEKKYEIVSKSGGVLEICEHSKALIDLYLANNMEEQYLTQKAAYTEQCRGTFTLDEAYGR